MFVPVFAPSLSVDVSSLTVPEAARSLPLPPRSPRHVTQPQPISEQHGDVSPRLVRKVVWSLQNKRHAWKYKLIDKTNFISAGSDVSLLQSESQLQFFLSLSVPRLRITTLPNYTLIIKQSNKITNPNLWVYVIA